MVLRFEQHHKGHNPFEEIKCPVCETDKFVSMDHASVWCDNCNAEFQVRHTSGDPGYVVDCKMEWVHGDCAKNKGLLEEKPYCVVKNGEPPKWIIISKNLLEEDCDYPHSLDRFLEKYEKAQLYKKAEDAKAKKKSMKV